MTEKPYQTEWQFSMWAVVGPGYTRMVADKISAESWAEDLNEAFCAGFHQGTMVAVLNSKRD